MVAVTPSGERGERRVSRPLGLVRAFERPLAAYHLLLGSTAILLTFGLVMVLSASSVTSYSSSGSSFTVFERQAVWVAVGLPLMYVATRLPPRAYRALAYPLLGVSTLLLLAVLVPGVGNSAFGATRWIDLPGGLQLQPSEPAKLGLVLWAADLVTRKERLGLLRDAKHLLLPLAPVTLCMVGLIMLEPDLGTSLVLLGVLLAVLFVAGAPLRVFGGLFASLAGIVLLLAIIEPYRLQRLTSFTDPFKDMHGAGYQAVQGFYALGSGGWWGLGLGASREKWFYLPNAHTDYIFAIIGEELGLVGTFLVLALFATLAYAGLRVARESTDTFVRLASVGVVTWLMVQALVNIGYVIGLLPVTGIPLPLVSFGGSALLPTMFALGMLLSFARRSPATVRLHKPGRRKG